MKREVPNTMTSSLTWNNSAVWTVAALKTEDENTTTRTRPDMQFVMMNLRRLEL